MFKLAHLSDIHLPPLPNPKVSDLINKRLAGYVNWHRNRRFSHLRSVLDKVVGDLKTQNPDHIAITGDLTNLGLPVEFAAATNWLARLGSEESVSVIPGNHDAYVSLWQDSGWKRWHAYMSNNGTSQTITPASGSPTHFPFVRMFGSIAIIGLNSAVVTPPFYAYGRLGHTQRTNLSDILKILGRQNAYRIILIHHPPLAKQTTTRRNLKDSAKLAKILQNTGAELVLHGHNHQWSLTKTPGPNGPIPIVQSPSASQGRSGNYPLAGYHLIEIQNQNGKWQTTLTARGLSKPQGEIVEISRNTLFS